MSKTTRLSIAISALLFIMSAATASDTSAEMLSSNCDKPEGSSVKSDVANKASVNLAYLVDEDGKVITSKLLKSSGDAKIDRTSIRAGSRCQFRPGTRDGKAIVSWAQVNYVWVTN